MEHEPDKGRGWAILVIYGICGVALPYVVTNIIFGGFDPDDEFQCSVAGALGMAGLGLTYWLHNRI